MVNPAVLSCLVLYTDPMLNPDLVQLLDCEVQTHSVVMFVFALAAAVAMFVVNEAFLEEMVGVVQSAVVVSLVVFVELNRTDYLYACALLASYSVQYRCLVVAAMLHNNLCNSFRIHGGASFTFSLLTVGCIYLTRSFDANQTYGHMFYIVKAGVWARFFSRTLWV